MTDKKPMTNFHTLTDQELEQISGGGGWLDYLDHIIRKNQFLSVSSNSNSHL